MKKFLLLFCISGALIGCTEKSDPKNIILFIGDGMGSAQLTAGLISKGSLEMERCPVVGLVTTWAANTLVTDSAAGATAMATGFKTNKGVVSEDPEGKRLKTVVEFAEQRGKSTGLVATSAITHATPACFATHVSHRSEFNNIAKQLAESEVDVLFGGGLDHFSPSNKPSCLPKLQARMTVVTTAEEFRGLGAPERAAALLYGGHPPYAAERDVSLKELTKKAIEILSLDDDGFFLMVEGSQIDWAGHQNDATNIIGEVVDFDDAVGVGLDFAEQNDDTLVIITSDHETGGFAVIDGSLEKCLVTRSGFSTDYHSATIVPLFAFGPGSGEFAGLLDNTDIGKKIIRLVK